MWLVLDTQNRANARLKELVPNVNSIIEAPQADKKERRQQKKKCFGNEVTILVSQLQKPLGKLVCKILPTLYEIGSAEKNKYFLQDSDFFTLTLFD